MAGICLIIFPIVVVTIFFWGGGGKEEIQIPYLTNSSILIGLEHRIFEREPESVF